MQMIDRQHGGVFGETELEASLDQPFLSHRRLLCGG